MHYKAPDHSVHHLDSTQFEHLLPAGSVQITDEEAEAMRVATQVPTSYADLRRAEYPPMEDLIDGLVKDDADQVQAYKDACFAVKKKYPKP